MQNVIIAIESTVDTDGAPEKHLRWHLRSCCHRFHDCHKSDWTIGCGPADRFPGCLYGCLTTDCDKESPTISIQRLATSTLRAAERGATSRASRLALRELQKKFALDEGILAGTRAIPETTIDVGAERYITQRSTWVRGNQTRNQPCNCVSHRQAHEPTHPARLVPPPRGLIGQRDR